MKERYVIDTNVLIAASASDPKASRNIDATPSDPEERMKVWEWLNRFLLSNSRLVIDGGCGIEKEYRRNLGFGDFGLQVVIQKMQRADCDFVSVSYDENGHGIIPGELASIVHDREDRKMVAAAIEAHAEFGEGCVAFAGDTDWHDWESALTRHNVVLEPIIRDWSLKKYNQKKKLRNG